MLEEFGRVAEGVSYDAPTVPFVSNLTGRLATAEQVCSPGYWVRHVRETVRFADGVGALAEQGVTAFVELGPDGVLAALVPGSLGERSDGTLVVPVARKDRDGQEALVEALARLHTHGVGVDWDAFHAGTGVRHVDLPTYPFQRERFWPETPQAETVPAVDSVDAEFWAAVEREDLESLASRLEIDGDSLGAVLPALSSWHRQQREQSVVDGWRHRVTWRALTGASAGTPDASGMPTTPRGTWLVVVPAGVADDRWVSSVTGAVGTGTVVLEVGDTDREELADRLEGYAADGVTFAGVVSLLALRETATPGSPAVPGGITLTTALIQALGDAGVEARLWAVTRGAVAIGGSEQVTDPLQHGVWGLGRVAALEYPQSWGGLIDLPAGTGGPLDDRLDDELAARFAGVLAAGSGSRGDSGSAEDQVAVRSTGVYARRLVPAAPTGSDELWQPTGTVLITGGTGALGGHVARWLAGAGAEHLLLTSRRGADAPGAEDLRAELAGLGARVSIVACDMADRDAVADLLACVPADQPLTGIVHTAGVLDDGLLDGMTPERFEAVFRAKAESALVLDELTQELGLDLSVFAMFSSIAGALGSRGQANYAAANAVLDALAARRRGQGLAATSVAWGLWAGSGMAAASPAESASERGGVLAMEPELAVAALARLVADEDADPAAVVAAVQWERFASTFSSVRPSPLLREIPAAGRAAQALASAAATGGDSDDESLRDRLVRMPAPERASAVVRLVRGTAAAVLGFDSVEQVESTKSFGDLGFDSLIAVEFSNRLAAATQLRLKQALVFDYPNPTALAHHLLEQLLPEGVNGATGNSGPVFADIDRLEEALTGAGTHRETRHQARERLQLLLARLGEQAAADGADPTHVDQELQEASDEEMFDFIGKEFGIS